MLNFKKGLAIVLAAATALTFAPVANFGTTVTAKAAETSTQTFNITQDLFTDTATGFFSNAATKPIAGGREFNGLKLGVTVTAIAGHTYVLNSISNVKDIKVYNGIASNTATYASASGTVSNNTVKAQSDGYIYFGLTLTKRTGGDFWLKDTDQRTANSLSNIHVQITNTYGAGANTTTSDVKVMKSTGGAALTEADKDNANDGSRVYVLQMNTTSNPYYLNVPLETEISSWTGATASASKAVVTSTSGGAEFVSADDNSGIKTTIATQVATTIATTPAETVDAQKKAAFIVTTAHPEKLTMSIKYLDSKDDEIGTTSVDYTVQKSEHAIDYIKWGKEKYTTAGGKSPEKYDLTWQSRGADAYELSSGSSTYSHVMDPYKNKSVKIVVKSESDQVTFVSTDTKIVDVKADPKEYNVATVTAKAVGSATINIYVGSTNNNKGKMYILPVKVNENGEDTIVVTDSDAIYGLEDDDTINLDAKDQTSAGAVKSDVVTFKSEGGLKFKDYVASGDKDAVKISQAGGVLTITSDKTISQLSQPAVVTIKMETITESLNPVYGTDKTITVVVWAKPAAQFTVDPVYLSLSDATKSTKILKTNPDTFTSVAWYIGKNQATSTTLADDDQQAFTLTNDSTGNNKNTAKIIAKKFGTGTVKAVVLETATTRKTAKIANVTVGADQANKITVDHPSLILAEGETAAITGTSSIKNAVTFSSADPTIASVTTGGAVTAVKAGQTTITAKSDGATDVVIPVVVTEKKADVVYANPAKITGLKVSNKKGAKVTVKFTKDTTNETMKYYVQKKVGKKTSGKSIGSTKTTLSVKKGATVKVRVKAYYYDANGVKHVGKYSAWKTLKTDKK